MSEPKVRNYWDREESERQPAVFHPAPEPTQQQFKDECDINNIVRRDQMGGSLEHLIRNDGKYADFSDAPTFMEAQEIVLHAQRQFETLPAAARERFNNSPANFLEFVNTEGNEADLLKLGLAVEPTPPKEDPLLIEVKAMKSSLDNFAKKASKTRSTQS